MTAADLAALHQRCFTVPRPWSAAEFASFLTDPLCFLSRANHGFALGRAVAGEAELLTIAVDPSQRRSGLGRQLMQQFEQDAAARAAQEAFLEVAADNAAALALYQSAGYRESGRRPGYYRSQTGAKIDAVLMNKSLQTA